MNARSSIPAILLALLGVLFIALAIFYATTDTGLLASAVGRHYKHAIVAAVLGVLCFVGANFARRRQF
jgi:drug/metabolite transporter (DMT)-like permease